MPENTKYQPTNQPTMSTPTQSDRFLLEPHQWKKNGTNIINTTNGTSQEYIFKGEKQIKFL